MIVADASFIVAAFAPSDDHNRAAWRWWSKHQVTVVMSRLALFEAENTIRGFPLGGKCGRTAVAASIEGIKRALLEGLVEQRDVAAKRLLPRARRLSEHYTTHAVFGALDILHVATAMELGASTFLSFDNRQRELAKAEGLLIQP